MSGHRALGRPHKFIEASSSSQRLAVRRKLPDRHLDADSHRHRHHWFPAEDVTDEFWKPGAERQPGWPTVKVRYLNRFTSSPLSIDRLRNEGHHQAKLLLDGFQGSSFPITEQAFEEIVGFLGLNPDQFEVGLEGDFLNPLTLSSLWERYKDAAPVVKERISRQYERGPVGSMVKHANGYRCQLCDALGNPWEGFTKPDGTYYIEAHHVVLVSTGTGGVLSPSNVITVCPNHHRQLHYGRVYVEEHGDEFRFVMDDGQPVRVRKFQQPSLAHLIHRPVLSGERGNNITYL